MGPSLRSSPESITNSISCTPREPSSIGTSERVWKRENSPKLVRISPPSRRTTKKSVSRPPKPRTKRRAWNEQSNLPPLQKFTLHPICLSFIKKLSKKKKKKKKSTLVDTTA